MVQNNDYKGPINLILQLENVCDELRLKISKFVTLCLRFQFFFIFKVCFLFFPQKIGLTLPTSLPIWVFFLDWDFMHILRNPRVFQFSKK